MWFAKENLESLASDVHAGNISEHIAREVVAKRIMI